MKPSNARVLKINGGSSGTKFSLFEAGNITLILAVDVPALLAMATAW